MKSSEIYIEILKNYVKILNFFQWYERYDSL